MTTSKATILNSIRSRRPAAVELPALTQTWTTYADRRQQFADVLSAVGGQVLPAAEPQQLNDQLRAWPAYEAAQKIASLVPDVGDPNVDLRTIDSPHGLADIDVAILAGEFAVAENGAVWVTDRNVPHRVVYFLCQHLVLVVPVREIVDNMHAAYERLAAASADGPATFVRPVFGAFISGPSKTADIEQSLVIGAHGPRSLSVAFLG